MPPYAFHYASEATPLSGRFWVTPDSQQSIPLLWTVYSTPLRVLCPLQRDEFCFHPRTLSATALLR